jgi:hypothetical protein
MFSKVLLNDADGCGPSCRGYTVANPNTKAVVDKHWEYFKTAANAIKFKFQARFVYESKRLAARKIRILGGWYGTNAHAVALQTTNSLLFALSTPAEPG